MSRRNIFLKGEFVHFFTIGTDLLHIYHCHTTFLLDVFQNDVHLYPSGRNYAQLIDVLSKTKSQGFFFQKKKFREFEVKRILGNSGQINKVVHMSRIVLVNMLVDKNFHYFWFYLI